MTIFQQKITEISIDVFKLVAVSLLYIMIIFSFLKIMANPLLFNFFSLCHNRSLLNTLSNMVYHCTKNNVIIASLHMLIEQFHTLFSENSIEDAQFLWYIFAHIRTDIKHEKDIFVENNKAFRENHQFVFIFA